MAPLAACAHPLFEAKSGAGPLGRGNPTLGSPGLIAYPTNGQASKVFHALTEFPNVMVTFPEVQQ